MERKPGRPLIIGRGEKVRAVVSPDMSAALDQLVELTGESKASLVRRGVGLVLAEGGLWEPTAAHRTVPMPTARPRIPEETTDA